MSHHLRDDVSKRLGHLEATLSQPDFLQQTGLGNEIAFYIFAYDAACAPLVTSYLPKLTDALALKGVNVVTLDMYQLALEVLAERDVLHKAFALEKDKGTAALRKAIGRLLVTDNLIGQAKQHLAQPHNLVFLTGVGEAWPLLRSHTILNNLHDVVDAVPLVMFYPGTYSGQGLQLFSHLTDDNYYRAFPLLPPEPS